jgi:hypothetical protein
MALRRAAQGLQAGGPVGVGQSAVGWSEKRKHFWNK